MTVPLRLQLVVGCYNIVTWGMVMFHAPLDTLLSHVVINVLLLCAYSPLQFSALPLPLYLCKHKLYKVMQELVNLAHNLVG